MLSYDLLLLLNCVFQQTYVICRNSKCSYLVFATSYFIESSIHTFPYLCLCNWRWLESITLKLLALMVNNIVFWIIYAKLNIAALEACSLQEIWS